MEREAFTETEIEEIERLKRSEAVRLARAEQRIKYRRRQYLYTLRNLERRGIELLANGWTVEAAEAELKAEEARLKQMEEEAGV
jgi:hypothetical protein